jgi:hypothetical protein
VLVALLLGARKQLNHPGVIASLQELLEGFNRTSKLG